MIGGFRCDVTAPCTRRFQVGLARRDGLGEAGPIVQAPAQPKFLATNADQP